MKTKKEIREAIIKRNVWNKKRDQIIPMILLLFMVIVGIWKFDRLFVHFDLYTFAKIYLIAIGAGYCFGSMICYLFIKVDLKKEKHSINKKIIWHLNQIEKICDDDEISKDPNLKYPVFDEEREKVLRMRAKKQALIRKLRDRINKLEVEYLLLENE